MTAASRVPLILRGITVRPFLTENGVHHLQQYRLPTGRRLRHFGIHEQVAVNASVSRCSAYWPFNSTTAPGMLKVSCSSVRSPLPRANRPLKSDPTFGATFTSPVLPLAREAHLVDLSLYIGIREAASFDRELPVEA